ncbi:MAG: GAF domain-containing protein, partial [Verrucomicrobiaceae bacterium]
MEGIPCKAGGSGGEGGCGPEGDHPIRRRDIPIDEPLAFPRYTFFSTRRMKSPTLSGNEPSPWADGLYSIKRHGVTISNCDSEPVQTPGCIQAHGVLLVLDSEGLTVLQVSENVSEHLGQMPEYYLGGPAEAVLGETGGLKLRDFCQRETIDRNPIYAFTHALGNTGAEYDLLVHGMDGLIVVECEPRPEMEERSVDSYSLVKRSVGRLQAALTLDEFCQTVAAEVRAVTGIDRVMVYKFHEDFHGEVVAESKREDLAPWLGLHYPAEDIPWPAREIFKKIWVRPLPDAAGPLIEIVPLQNPLTGKALDMTHCGLRGASVMYTEYLANMGVAASLT